MTAVTSSSHRPWENAASPTANVAPRGQLPSISALTNNLPPAPTSSGLPSPASTRERDSGAWSSQPQSTRSSAYSSGLSSYPMSSATNSYYMSPNRVSNSSQLGSTSHPAELIGVAPSSMGSPGFAPPAPSMLPLLNRVHDPNRVSDDPRQSKEFPPQESRRSSVGSQVNQGMNSLQINGANSPYTGSVNHSSTSLAQNLSRERGITTGPSLRNSRSSAQLPLSPLSPQAQDSETRLGTFGPRIAPPIGRNPRSDVYNANEPAPGQAYAFPDPPDMQPGDLPPRQRLHSNHSHERATSFDRRHSGANSVTSSVLTNDSRLPMGQRRLEDQPEILGTHHHTLQQSQMSNYDEDEAMTPDDGVTPYSRTPALRVSHKMAERKRRSEMKDLFENLRSQIPSNQGSKSSKWEILTKATEYIKTLESSAQNGGMAEKQLRAACHDLDLSRRDNDSLRNENQRLMQEIQMLRQQQPPPHGVHAHSSPPGLPQAQGLYQSFGQQPSLHDPINRSLPPLAGGAGAGSGSMQGVQYSNEPR